MGALAALITGNDALAGPWSIEPLLGVSADYNTNPLLQETGGKSEEHIAGIVDLPLRYDTDELEFLLRPNGRISNSQGYSSLASNYEHLDTAAHYYDEIDSATLQGEVARDSSLYFVGGLVNHVGVPRDTAQTNGDFTRSITERSQVSLDASWQRVRYVEPADLNFLIDYRYYSGGPAWSYALSERNSLKLLGNYGFYQSLNGATQSKSENLQLGFTRQLTEIWALSATAGYSKSANVQKTQFEYFGYLIPVTERSNQNGTVYAGTLTRQGERLSLSLGASRALQPTGLAFLSRQDSYNISVSYARSERWDVFLSAAWLRAINPQVIEGEAQLNSQDQTARYFNTHLTINRHLTTQWVLSVTAVHISQQYGPPLVSAESTGITVSLVRQFLRSQF